MKRKNGMPKASIPRPIDIRREAQEPRFTTRRELMTTDKETPFTTPQPPHETALGKDSIPADAVAQVQEDAIVAEELATDE